MSNVLPEKFSSLSRWADWGKPTELERYQRRAACTMEELKSFYDALKPHMEDIIQHLSAFPWGSEISASDERLFHMAMTYMEAAVPIDLNWKSPMAEDSYPVSRLSLPVRL